MARRPKSPASAADSPEDDPRSAVMDVLLDMVRFVGPDTKVDDRGVELSLVRGRQFGLIEHAKGPNIQLFLSLPGQRGGRRLRSLVPARGCLTHRVEVATPSQVDPELMLWLVDAYDGAE